MLAWLTDLIFTYQQERRAGNGCFVSGDEDNQAVILVNFQAFTVVFHDRAVVFHDQILNIVSWRAHDRQNHASAQSNFFSAADRQPAENGLIDQQKTLQRS